MNALVSDIRYSIRQLIKSPAFTAVAVISLALAIGANTAVFSLYNALLLKPLPVRDAGRLRVLTWEGDINAYFTYCRVTGGTGNVVSYPLYDALREQAADLADVFAFSEFGQFGPLTVIAAKETFTAQGLIVSGNFFDGLGLEPRLGRTIAPEHDQPQAEPVTVISSAVWRRCFNGDPDVIGRSVTLNRRQFTVIGVLPEDFLGLLAGSRCDFYMPMSAQSLVRPECPLTATGVWWVQLMARLSPGVGDEQLRASLETVLNRAVTDEAMSGSGKPVRVVVEDGSRGLLAARRTLTESLPALMGIVGLVLLAACVNLASLLLARGAARQHETAVRAALGAGRWPLIRQSLTESFLVALAGAAGGLLLATWAKHLMLRLFWRPQTVIDLRLDVRVAGFTLAIGLGSALLFGLIPAWRSSRIHATAALKERSARSLSRLRLGNWMVSVQTALALLMLVGAGLFVRSLANLYRVETGFDTENLLVFGLDASKADLEGQQHRDYFEQAQAAIAALPGVRSVAHSNIVLLSRWMNNSEAQIPGRPPDDRIPILGLSVTDSYLSTMGIPLLLGRDFTPTDNEAGQPVILVNETLARTAFPGQDPLGRILKIGRDYRIVGVFADITYVNLKKAPEPIVFFSCLQEQAGHLGKRFVHVRTAVTPQSLVPAVRQILTDINPNIPMTDIKTQAMQLDESIAKERCFALLALPLALLAVLLSCIGLFGLMAFHTTQRTGEIGIRLALGARPWDVGRSVLRDALRLVLVGAALGVPLVLVTSRLIRSYLFGIEPYDPVTLAGATILLTLVSLAAVWPPARRAAKIDPMEALRYE